MLAAKHGSASVVGCEMFKSLAGIAQEVVADNGLAEVVQIGRLRLIFYSKNA